MNKTNKILCPFDTGSIIYKTNIYIKLDEWQDVEEGGQGGGGFDTFIYNTALVNHSLQMKYRKTLITSLPQSKFKTSRTPSNLPLSVKSDCRLR